jgi:DNA-binding response OmpR family regulator
MTDKGPRPVGDKSKINILIVEDKPDHAEIIQGYLEPDGYRLRLARNRAEAIEMIEAEPPDLLILDLLLDGDKSKPEGYEVCRWLRQNPKTVSIPVLMFTVLDELEQIERGVEVEADDYLVKLSSPEEIRFRVEKLLAVRHIKNKARRMIEYLRLIEFGREGGSTAPQSLEDA